MICKQYHTVTSDMAIPGVVTLSLHFNGLRAKLPFKRHVCFQWLARGSVNRPTPPDGQQPGGVVAQGGEG